MDVLTPLAKSTSRKWVKTSGGEKLSWVFLASTLSSQLIEIWEMGNKTAVSDGICKLVEAKWIFAWSVKTEKIIIRKKINVSPKNRSCFPADFSMNQNTQVQLCLEMSSSFSCMTLYGHLSSPRWDVVVETTWTYYTNNSSGSICGFPSSALKALYEVFSEGEGKLCKFH